MGDSLNDRLISFWDRVNKVCAQPLAAIIALGVSSAWITASILTSGQAIFYCDGRGCHWDPGAQYGSFLENQLQLVLIFVCAAAALKGAAHAKAAHGHAKAARAVSEGNRRAIEHAHSRLDAIHEKIGPQVKETLSKC